MARPGISTKNTEKIPPGPKFWTPRIYPQSTPKIPTKYPQNTQNAHFWYFFGIFGVFSWGSRISAQGVFFRYFSWKFQVGPSRGSVAGRGVLNSFPLFDSFSTLFLNFWVPGAGRPRQLIFNSVSNFGPEGPKNSSGGWQGRKFHVLFRIPPLLFLVLLDVLFFFFLFKEFLAFLSAFPSFPRIFGFRQGVVFPTFRLSISSCVFGRVKLIETD